MRVGFIGLGRMGRPMSQHLARASYRLTVHNRTRAKEAAVVSLGATSAASPPEVADRSDVVLTCLPTLEATREVFLGPHGIATQARPGLVLVDHSTIGPRLARDIAACAAARGAAFLDAPVSGGPDGAEAARLTIMVGGDAEAFSRVRPLFEVMGDNVQHVGDVGTGSTVKLVNQLLTFAHATVAAEALLLGAAAGTSPQTLHSVLRTAWGRSAMFDRAVERSAARDFTAGAPLRLYQKDLTLVRELAGDLGLELPMTDTASTRLARALESGLEEEDLVAVLRPYEDQSSVRVGGIAR